MSSPSRSVPVSRSVGPSVRIAPVCTGIGGAGFPDHGGRDRRPAGGGLAELVNSPRAYGLSDLVLSGFLRVVTHPRVFREPSPPDMALAFVSEGRDRPSRVPATPGPRHWEIFLDTCAGDYARFTGLRLRHPLEG